MTENSKTNRFYLVNHTAGFSLIELLIVIGLIGVLAAVATPQFITWKQNANLNDEVRTLYGLLQSTRMEAITRNTNCTFTFTYGAIVNGEPTDFVTFVDENANRIFDAGETVVRSAKLDTSVKAFGDELVPNAAAMPALSYNARGLPEGGGGTITLQGASGRTFKIIIHPITGRVRVQ